MIQRYEQTMDGNQAAAHTAYAFSEAAAIYPITPSSPMAELCDEWAVAGRKNIFGLTMNVSQMQSEAGAAGALHGALAAGALCTTFTSSQGLLLMLPNIYRIAGELLPGVIHVASRAIATHALSIFGEHSDIYACRQTGAAILCESNVQEVMDLSPVAHVCALLGSIPFINFFDGFRTSHELQKVSVWDYQQLSGLFPSESYEAFKNRRLSGGLGHIYGSAQNPDVFFQNREAANSYYIALPDIVEKTMAQINEMLGTSYGPVNYYGAPDAAHVIIAMGSVCDTIREYLMYENNYSSLKLGLISVHLYRPFPSKHLIQALPETVSQISVLSRCKEPGSPGEPLYLDVLSALKDSPFSNIPVYSGRYGLGSKDTSPAQIKAVYFNTLKKFFTIGIDDDVTGLSLMEDENNLITSDAVSCLFWGLGGDGMVSASKNIIKIIGDNTDLKVQGYFEYDSKKSGGLTISHLRYGSQPILSSYLIDKADILVCSEPEYLNKYKLADRIKDGGILLLNLPEGKASYCESTLLSLSEKNIRLFVIDAFKIGTKTGLNRKVSTIIQAAFFAVSNVLSLNEAKEFMIAYSDKAYKKAGEKVLAMNREAISHGLREVKEINISALKAGCTDSATSAPVKLTGNDFIDNIMKPILKKQGDELPVSAFVPYASGRCVPGTSAYEKRNIADKLPNWIPENCIQCNRCSLVCPHAVIRPFLLTKEEAQNVPDAATSIPVSGLKGEQFADYGFTIGISCHDCTGCGSCVAVCPGRGDGKKALEMKEIYDEILSEQAHFDYCVSLPVRLEKKEALQAYSRLGVKSSQFNKPLMEFSGACSGCGETPYVKLLTQLFGAKLCISNATGCSSIWANSYPSCIYCEDESGNAPSWSNSLFEDAAEFGYGMKLAHDIRNDNQTIQWVIGGDGWAYDIGFGGVDHVLSGDKDINLLVLDTECYSNTGGQASKATPLGSSAKFAAGGKKTAKRDLATIAITYKNAYVASVALGADMEQTVRAFKEAVAYPGPSLIIAYATCISHGLTSGMGSSMHEEKKAVDAGYVNLFRYNPSLIAEGKNPLIIDSKPPKIKYEEFLEGENRYKIIAHDHPEKAKELFNKAEEDANSRYNNLKKMT